MSDHTVVSDRTSEASLGLVQARLIGIALRARFLGVAAFIVLLALVFSATAPGFFSVGNGITIAFNSSILVIAVCAETMVLLTRNLDLSIGSTMGLVGYVVADLAARHPELGPSVILIALALGALLGLVNGLLVGYGKLPSIIATLGTLSVYRGITFIYARGQEITSYELPPWLISAVDARVLGVPVLVLVAVGVVALTSAFLANWPIGRTIYAVGSNPAASYFYGIRRDRVVVVAYALSGVLAGFAGFIYGAHIGTVTVVLASGWELEVLAAAVIGGVSILGGSGSVIGAALGAVVLATIDNGLILLRVDEFWRLFIQGTAIVLAVSADAFLNSRLQSIFKGMKRR